MAECFKCGVSEERAILYDAISGKGIVKICRHCSIVENLPIIRRVTEESIEKKNAPERVPGRSGMRRYIRNPSGDDMALRNLVENNFRQNMKEDSELKTTLIDNFHWALMRARRAKKLTQEQLAQAIKVPHIAIQTLEMGVVPEKSRDLISKLEIYLFVKLRKTNSSAGKKVDFNLGYIGNSKVSDLKESQGKGRNVEINDDLKFEM